MHSTTTSVAPGTADRRVARRRVGAAAILAFLALLLAGAVRDAAGANPAVPAAAPAMQPAQPQQTQPQQTQPQQTQPQQTEPAAPQQTAPADPSFPREHDGGRGFGGGGGGFGGGGVPDNGGGTAPAAPSTSGGVTT